MVVSDGVVRQVEEIILSRAEEKIEKKVLQRVDQILAEQKKEEKPAPAPYVYVPLELKQDVRRIIERGIIKQKSLYEIKQAIRHYFRKEGR